MHVGLGCGGTEEVGYGVVLVYGVQLVLLVGGWGDGGMRWWGVVWSVGLGGMRWYSVVGDGAVLPMQLVCVGKLACSQICRLGVVGIYGSVFERCSFGLFFVSSLNLVFTLLF